MKGHLGFPCRPCVPAEAPVVEVVTDDEGTMWFRWLAPHSSRPIVAWHAYSESVYGAGYEVLDFAQTVVAGTPYHAVTAGACKDSHSFRVAAITECGDGVYSEFATANPSWTGTPTSQILTENTIFNTPWPCGLRYLTAFAIGKGGQSTTGGGGGGLAWKTWDWLDWSPSFGASPTYSITSSQSSVTFSGTTIVAYAGSNTETGGFSGGDGGAYGNPPGQGNTSFSPAGIPYSGTYYWGGSIGGGDPGAGGEIVRPSPVSPCQRQPAHDRNNLLARVSLAGGKVVEDCGVQAAFGSGGVRVPYSAYGSSSQYFAPGYGGGGFDSECPAGPGAVLFYFHN